MNTKRIEELAYQINENNDLISGLKKLLPQHGAVTFHRVSGSTIQDVFHNHAFKDDKAKQIIEFTIKLLEENNIALHTALKAELK